MVVVSAREFRVNQGKYLGMANTQKGILLKSRFGTFKISPVSEDDMLISKEEYFRRIEEARDELKAGGGTVLRSHEDVDNLLDSL